MKVVNELEQTLSFCREKLEEHNFRITPQRVGIFSCLLQSKDHPSAEMVHHRVKKEFPNMSFDTVNRTLHCLAEKGLIRVVESGPGPRRFDARLKRHYHFRCCNCKKIVDFDCAEYDSIKIPEYIAQKFKVFRQDIILEGLCSDCAIKKESKE